MRNLNAAVLRRYGSIFEIWYLIMLRLVFENKSRKQYTILFRVFLIVVLAGIGWNCSGNEILVVQPKSTVKITSQPSAAEGVPGLEYEFSAITDNSPIKPKFEWLVDDSVIAVTASKVKINYTFPRDGWYFVKLNLYDATSGRLAAADLLQVNIRSSFPSISMLTIPAGTFIMGSDKNFYEQPVRTVVIPRKFAMGKYEVLQSQWQKLMGYNPAWLKGDSLPVENVSWRDMVDFCNRLSVRSGFVPCYTIDADSVRCNFTADGYRLPTEAEWEYAARAGTTTETYIGNFQPATDGCTPADPSLEPIGWYCANAEGITHQVGRKLPNAFGLYDMCGNVAELCWDYYDGTYYQTAPSTYPLGPDSGSRRVLRGGAFINDIFTMRLSYRDSQFPYRPNYAVGFRVVRSLP